MVAALGTYLQARSQDGDWLVRIEDLDPERSRPHAASDILRTLDAFGLEWDGAVLYQSARLDAYRSAAAALLAQDMVYSCTCSRRQVAESGSLGLDGPVYAGTCRRKGATAVPGASLRLRTNPSEIAVTDALQGTQRQRLAQQIGDFVIQRADGVYAYQLAVVVDDAEQGITEVVRGADLWASTPRQVYMQRLLGLPTPLYAHLPVAVNVQGRKLSKSDAAAPVDPCDPLPALMAAWAFLGQETPPGGPRIGRPFGLGRGRTGTLDASLPGIHAPSPKSWGRGTGLRAHEASEHDPGGATPPACGAVLELAPRRPLHHLLDDGTHP